MFIHTVRQLRNITNRIKFDKGQKLTERSLWQGPGRVGLLSQLLPSREAAVKPSAALCLKVDVSGSRMFG